MTMYNMFAKLVAKYQHALTSYIMAEQSESTEAIQNIIVLATTR